MPPGYFSRCRVVKCVAGLFAAADTRVPHRASHKGGRMHGVEPTLRRPHGTLKDRFNAFRVVNATTLRAYDSFGGKRARLPLEMVGNTAGYLWVVLLVLGNVAARATAGVENVRRLF